MKSSEMGIKKGVSDTQLQSPLKLLKVSSTHACHQGIQSVFMLLWKTQKSDGDANLLNMCPHV